MLSASAHSMAASMRSNTCTPISRIAPGRSERGPQTATSAPMACRPKMLERATREWSTSPTMQTLRPSREPSLSRSVSRSSSACVGCSHVPSPALITLDSIRSARKRAAPEPGCRTTTMSMRIASRFRAVSTSVSPLETLEPSEATFTVSADIRFSANSNEMRVRVEGSKKRLTTVMPRSVGTFLMVRSEISFNGSATSRMVVICSRLSPASPRRSLPSPLTCRRRRGPLRRGRRARGRTRPRGSPWVRRASCQRRPRGSGVRVRHDR